MSGMNPWLASIYGTDGADDLEKTAQTHLLQKLAAENNIDLSQLEPEELQQLLAEVMAEQGDPAAQQHMQGGPEGQPGMGASQGLPQQQMAPQQGQPMQRPQHPAMQQAFAPASQPQVPQGMPQGAMQQAASGGGDMAAMQKEAAAKFEEADLLGRVMAHAYTQELEKIAMTKTAGKMDAMKGAVNSARNSASHAASRIGAKASSKATEIGMKARANKGAIGAAAATGAVGFAAGRASKSKEASVGPAFLKLAEMHAAEILSTAGFDPQTGTDTYAQQDQGQQAQAPQEQGQQPQQEAVGQEEQQAPGAEFAQQLDETALNMLAEAGYDVNEILARLQFAQQNQAQA